MVSCAEHDSIEPRRKRVIVILYAMFIAMLAQTYIHALEHIVIMIACPIVVLDPNQW